ncbi:uncharacterized protein [Rutidosis leptorrhynchoides]|uniref:uncharacterized protein n=1 Tax=Rutidosis leptorrhynchoides TaxID=125765 RepID=UPI003A9A46D9
MNAVNWFWKTGEISNGCNASFVTLVPKIRDPLGLNDFRPISLIGSYYKIVAKTLSNRLRKVVPSVVGVEQSAFLKGRYILAGVLISNETIDYIKRKRGKGIIFKVDFKKAFDCLNWEFLIEVITCMGFGDKWLRGLYDFFDEWNRDNLRSLLNLLQCFELASGLEVNMCKSNLLGVGVAKYEVLTLANYIGYDMGSIPFKYLGLPIGTKMKKLNAWKGVLDKRKLSDWKLYGGLNIGTLKCKNLALLDKWLWRFYNKPESLWVKIIKSIYGPGEGISSPLPRSYATSIMASSTGPHSQRQWVADLPKDMWLCSERLEDRFGILYLLEVDGNVSVAFRIVWNENSCSF